MIKMRFIYTDGSNQDFIEFSADPEQTLPEEAVVESAKSYREKKAKPLVMKMVQVMRSIYSAYLDISNKFTKLQAAYNRERSGNERLTNRLEEVLETGNCR